MNADYLLGWVIYNDIGPIYNYNLISERHHDDNQHEIMAQKPTDMTEAHGDITSKDSTHTKKDNNSESTKVTRTSEADTKIKIQREKTIDSMAQTSTGAMIEDKQREAQTSLGVTQKKSEILRHRCIETHKLNNSDTSSQIQKQAHTRTDAHIDQNIDTSQGEMIIMTKQAPTNAQIEGEKNETHKPWHCTDIQKTSEVKTKSCTTDTHKSTESQTHAKHTNTHSIERAKNTEIQSAADMFYAIEHNEDISHSDDGDDDDSFCKHAMSESINLVDIDINDVQKLFDCTNSTQQSTHFSNDIQTNDYFVPESDEEKEIVDCDVDYIPETDDSDDGSFPSPSLHRTPIKHKRRKKYEPLRDKEWKRNVDKTNRRQGLEYKTNVGKNIDSRIMGDPCTSAFCVKTPRRQCNKLTYDLRCKIFEMFWIQLATWTERKLYVITSVKKTNTKQNTAGEGSRRKYSLEYNLTFEGHSFRVCKKLFVATLGMSERTLMHWLDRSEKENEARNSIQTNDGIGSVDQPHKITHEVILEIISG